MVNAERNTDVVSRRRSILDFGNYGGSTQIRFGVFIVSALLIAQMPKAVGFAVRGPRDSKCIECAYTVPAVKAPGDTSRAGVASESDNIGIGGLVIDHTISALGRNFVYLFNQDWNPPASLGSYTVVIEEKPMPTLGTLIFVKVNGNYVFKRFIQPRYSTIREAAREAAGIALGYAENYKQIEKQLDGEDMKGTGIY